MEPNANDPQRRTTTGSSYCGGMNVFEHAAAITKNPYDFRY
jgi:hypothetical protein